MLPDSSTREIPLTQGRFALVDAEDFEMLSKWSWHATAGGYPQAYNGSGRSRDREVRMSRLIMLPGPGQVVDHINHDVLDNRRVNLRLCTQSQNEANQRKTHGASRYKGLYWHRQSRKWCARIVVRGQAINLGLFSDELDAASAYDAAAASFFGEFALLNFPDVP